MKEQSAQNLLSARYGERQVTIGVDGPDELRRLSNARLLVCPGCKSPLVLHAGHLRAHHFAHLPNAVCSVPQTEPETPEHRAGKLLLARWLRQTLPDAQITVEAHIVETNQRADLLVVLPILWPTQIPDTQSLSTQSQSIQSALPVREGVSSPGPAPGMGQSYLQDKTVNRFVARGQAFLPLQQRVAIEYQCANMTAREWRRRHQLYRNAGIQDLWILGGSRLIRDTTPVSARSASVVPASVVPIPAAPAPVQSPVSKTTRIRTSDLERGLLWDGAPLLFLDAVGDQMALEALVRFRPDADAQAVRPAGRLTTRPLLDLPFPFALLAWPDAGHPLEREKEERGKAKEAALARTGAQASYQLWEWLAQRHRVTPQTLPGFFGLPVRQSEAFACEPRAWQAAVYYRFIHGRVGDRWWLAEVETWTRAYLPLAHPVRLKQLQAALAEYQEILAAAGLLSLPRGYNRVHATVTDDLTTLSAPPDPDEVQRLARYRRTLSREARADYQAR